MKLNEFRKNIMDQDEHIAAANAIENAYHATALSQTKAQIGKPTMMVAYRSIIQCRQEMPLVKLAIDRHRRGESGDYVAEDNYADMASSAKLPSTYYKDVPCCENCYKIYNLIDGERNKVVPMPTHTIIIMNSNYLYSCVYVCMYVRLGCLNMIV